MPSSPAACAAGMADTRDSERQSERQSASQGLGWAICIKAAQRMAGADAPVNSVVGAAILTDCPARAQAQPDAEAAGQQQGSAKVMRHRQRQGQHEQHIGDAKRDLQDEQADYEQRRAGSRCTFECPGEQKQHKTNSERAKPVRPVDGDQRGT